jgi:uncharacterized protein YaiL (DUF2058 family)
MSSKYDAAVDRESAYELLQTKVIQEQAAEKDEQEQLERQKQLEKEEKERKRMARASEGRNYNRKTLVERAADNVVGTIGRELGRTLIRGILGSLKR